MNGPTASFCQCRANFFYSRVFRRLRPRHSSPDSTHWTPTCTAAEARPESFLPLPQPSLELSEFRKKRLLRRMEAKKEQEVYRLIAIAGASFIAALAALATYFKFFLTKPRGAPFPWLTFSLTLLLVLCGTAGMEMYARWAHKTWWHDTPSGWALHKSHHELRTGPFEANDIYAVANAVPAFALCYFGLINPSIVGSLCFGLGLGITLFGMAYMFVHDGLVHRRFPVGPMADVPMMKKVAAAHMIHHTDKYGGLPFGMFLGPQEIAHIPEAVEEMERLAAKLGNK